MEKDINEVTKITRKIKTKLEENDNDVKLFIEILFFRFYLQILVLAAITSLCSEYSPSAEFKEQAKARMREGNGSRQIKNGSDRVRIAFYSCHKPIQISQIQMPNCKHDISFNCSDLKKKLHDRMKEFQVSLCNQSHLCNKISKCLHSRDLSALDHLQNLRQTIQDEYREVVGRRVFTGFERI